MLASVASRSFSATELQAAYTTTFARSHELFRRGASYFPNGVSQHSRFYRPFPIFVESASGAELLTVEGRRLVDFWQGHFANLFGHRPDYLIAALSQSSCPFQLGLNTALEQEVAAVLCGATGTEQAVFCTTGAQATMLATLIGLAHSRRSRVVKIEGGWHGVQPWSLVGVKSSRVEADSSECAGLPSSLARQVIAVPFNDPERLIRVFESDGGDIGVVISELVLGNAGMEMATPEFVRCLRESCDRYGAVLVFDELVTGFRCHPGPLSALYGVRPDLATFGKIVAGGMPFAAIVGSRDAFRTVRAENPVRVLADVGTFTAHPGALTAVLATLRHIVAVGPSLYEGIEQHAASLRAGLRRLFTRHGIAAHVTGDSPGRGLPSFPIMTVQFGRENARAGGSLAHWRADLVDIALRDELSRAALCVRGIFPWQGGGVVTAAHSADHVATFLNAYDDWLSTWE